jgi:D-sedoheptulose 7-phosphate isomerase
VQLANAIKKARRVYIIGNGGSYANAVHICNDLLSVGIKCFTLDPASLTRTANDNDYSMVFADWLEVVAEQGDLLIALSGSGNSPNIIKALEKAKQMGMVSWALVGKPDCKAIEIADNAYISNKGMQAAEEIQLITGHEEMLCLKHS